MQKKFSKLHPKHLTWIMPLFLSGIMSGSISCFNMWLNKGMIDGFFFMWIRAWSISWLVAYPLILILLPLVRKLLMKYIIAEPPKPND